MEEERRDQILNSFKEFCAIDDNTVASGFLERCEWNLELAVQEFLNEKEGHPSIMSRERMENIANQRREQLQATYRNVQVRPVRNRLTWTEWIWSMTTLPFYYARSTLWSLVEFLYHLIFAPFRQAISADPAADVAQFTQNFNNRYGDTHPTFYQGSYRSAINDAKRELKYLLVYLHSELHQDTDRFCRETLCNRELINFINEKDIMVWACSVGLAEGYRGTEGADPLLTTHDYNLLVLFIVSAAMRETTYPFLAFVCQRDNRMMVVVRQEGFCRPTDLIESLSLAVVDNDIYLNLARQERLQHQQNQLLRQQQEHEFQESLRVDREKAEQRKREKQEQEAEARKLEMLEEERVKKSQEVAEVRRRIRASLPAEPNVSSPETAVRVSLKFPSGSRLERRFLLTDSLEMLHNVTCCHPDCPENFSIMNVYPRKVLRCVPTEDNRDPIITFADAGLTGAVTLLVHDNEA